jgi:predicted metalloprotease with PDZ domain
MNTPFYTICVSDPNANELEVTLTLRGLSPGPLRLLMPAWSPGSYLLREYARHVQRFQALAGEHGDEAPTLPWRKTARGAWEVQIPEGVTTLTVRYFLWAYELSVRCNYVSTQRVFINGASTWMRAEGFDGPCALEARAPREDWKIYTALPCADGAVTPLHRARFEAESYDHLVDCPIEMGDHQEFLFQASGAAHRLVMAGPHRAPVDQLVQEIPRIVKATRALFGELPYKQYLTLVAHADEGRGGLEHRDSTALIFPTHHYAAEHGVEDFLCLLTHEHFHAWNVKRIRPAVLGPFDYDREAYTRALWLMEGTTCYYETILMYRAGLMTAPRMLELLGQRIGEVSQTPGRKLRSLEEASFDAWIKHYRPDASSRNTTISYYLKGELISWLLDLEIRRRSDNQRSLDDVMRHLWHRYGRPDLGFDEDQLPAIFAEATGVDLTDCFARYVRGVEDPDWAALLSDFGLTFQPHQHDPARPTLGLTHREDGDRLLIDSVKQSGPAQQAGLYPGDELVALDNHKIDRRTLPALLAGRRPGEQIDLHVFRLGQLTHARLRLGSSPIEHYAITLAPDPSDRALSLRQRWLAR